MGELRELPEGGGAERFSPDRVFERVLRRRPTAEERERLLHVQKALELDDRDPFWGLVLILERYLSEVQTAARPTLGPAKFGPSRVGVSRAGAVEAPSTHGLSPWRSALGAGARLGLSVGGLLGAGAVGFLAGAGAVGAPWRGFVPQGSRALHAVAALLSAPVGWLVALALLPAAIQLGVVAWTRGRARVLTKRERARAWAVLVLLGLGLVGWAGLLGALGV